jgi:hypothetical protein
MLALQCLAQLATANDTACEKIRDANANTGSQGVKITTSGYAFSHDTPRIYSMGDQTCTYLRDEPQNGEIAEVYKETYDAPAGHTEATIWISKASGHLLREEQDGDVPGKGKGHISYTWSPH